MVAYTMWFRHVILLPHRTYNWCTQHFATKLIMTLCFFPGLFSKIVLCCRGAIPCVCYLFPWKGRISNYEHMFTSKKKNQKKARRGRGCSHFGNRVGRVVPHMSDTMLSPLARYGGNGHVLKGTDPSSDNRRSPDDHFMRPSIMNSLFLSFE